jgi:hypothetical protein
VKRFLIPAAFVLAALAGCNSTGAGGGAPANVQDWAYGTLTVTGCAQDNGLLVIPGPDVTIKNTSSKVVNLAVNLGMDPGTLWAMSDGKGYPDVTLQPGESEDYTIGDGSGFTPPDDPCALPIQILTDS